MLRKLAAASVIAAFPAVSHAATIISDGNVSLGIDDLGQLNVSGGNADVAGETVVGVRWIADTGVEYEGTSHGCLCEGWGIAIDGTTAGYADNADGVAGLSSVSFTSTATTAQSVVQLSGSDVFVTHDFQLSASDDLMEVVVTIENRGTTAVNDVMYRREMDWDASPTPFNEFVTIGGTSTTSLLAASSDDGFIGGDILSSPIAGSDLLSCGETVDFTACGPDDHGAVFDFDFGSIAGGDSYSFSIFYGGAENLDAAEAALGAVGAELFSFGWSGDDADQDGFSDVNGDLTPTFIFAFSGVGGTVIIPPTTPNPSAVPLPASSVLLLAGLGAIGAMRKRKTA
ncbi:VPLPA-CTERM sorting domain-containing protein [Aliishimia ponticola]|uniref:VPLPA-CTERM sorting domain-containing protein n=1 Tax=Aliishimia ponticola TaxID=2499833 RepID=A0A4S4NKZ4_9RHOB|nr:VPLPA-CTERM sorting domain-containing protein [Aliishimia ponticola]THH38968.1 VPLPA-CTERM sorting domain-containing protein [Aliishimia ponticola]